jgi:hypothetical protein
MVHELGPPAGLYAFAIYRIIVGIAVLVWVMRG